MAHGEPGGSYAHRGIGIGAADQDGALLAGETVVTFAAARQARGQIGRGDALRLGRATGAAELAAELVVDRPRRLLARASAGRHGGSDHEAKERARAGPGFSRPGGECSEPTWRAGPERARGAIDERPRHQ